jgi:hypothetical protein
VGSTAVLLLPLLLVPVGDPFGAVFGFILVMLMMSFILRWC